MISDFQRVGAPCVCDAQALEHPWAPASCHGVIPKPPVGRPRIVPRELVSEATTRYVVEVLDLSDIGVVHVRYRFPNGWGAYVLRSDYGGVRTWSVKPVVYGVAAGDVNGWGVTTLDVMTLGVHGPSHNIVVRDPGDVESLLVQRLRADPAPALMAVSPR